MHRVACLTQHRIHFMALALMMDFVACGPHGHLTFGRPYLPFDPVDIDGDGDLDILDDSGYTWHRMDHDPPVYRTVELLWWKEFSTHTTLAPSAEYPGGMALLEDVLDSLPFSLRLRLVAAGQIRDFTIHPFADEVEQVVFAEAPSLHFVALGHQGDSNPEGAGGLAVANFNLDPSFDWTQLQWRKVAPPPEFPEIYVRMLQDENYRARAYAHVRGLSHARFCYFAYTESPHLRSAVLDVVAGQGQLSWFQFPEVPHPPWVVGPSNPIPCRDIQGINRQDCMIIPRPTINRDQRKNGPLLFDRFELADDGEWKADGPTLSIPHEFNTINYVRLRSGHGHELMMTPFARDKKLRAQVIDARAPALAISAELVIPLIHSIRDWYWYDLNGDGLDDGVAGLSESDKHMIYLNRGDGTFEAVML